MAFGELEPYLGSRLGELSAGYQARVIFSIALHIPFDFLLFDEVFAVGDARFATRCLDRLRLARREGAAVVLATHTFKFAEDECDAAIYLDAGNVAAAGDVASTLAVYRRALARG